MTALHGLSKLAGLRRGERVLIHAAAGSVGLAAVCIARELGAEIWATAAPRKWPLLRRLGVHRLMSSRTLDFADTVLAETSGRGVDVVLNSLTGDGFVGASLSACSPRGPVRRARAARCLDRRPRRRGPSRRPLPPLRPAGRAQPRAGRWARAAACSARARRAHGNAGPDALRPL